MTAEPRERSLTRSRRKRNAAVELILYAFPGGRLSTREDSDSSGIGDDEGAALEIIVTYSRLVRLTAFASSCATT